MNQKIKHVFIPSDVQVAVKTRGIQFWFTSFCFEIFTSYIIFCKTVLCVFVQNLMGIKVSLHVIIEHLTLEKISFGCSQWQSHNSNQSHNHNHNNTLLVKYVLQHTRNSGDVSSPALGDRTRARDGRAIVFVGAPDWPLPTVSSWW